MAEGDTVVDDSATKDGGAAAAADGATKSGDATADAGKAAASADQGKEGDAAKAAEAEAARVAALTPEQKAAEDKAAADKKAADDKGGKKDDAAPVDYAKTIAEVKMPEGIVLDEVAVKAAGELFGKHKISAEAAAEFTALYAQQVKAGADAQAKAFADAVAVWKTESTKTYSKEDLADAKTAAGKMFDTKTVELMEHFGMMNHPGFIGGLKKVYPAIKDDSFVPGDAGGSGGGADARKAFPNSNMNP